MWSPFSRPSPHQPKRIYWHLLAKLAAGLYDALRTSGFINVYLVNLVDGDHRQAMTQVVFYNGNVARYTQFFASFDVVSRNVSVLVLEVCDEG